MLICIINLLKIKFNIIKNKFNIIKNKLKDYFLYGFHTFEPYSKSNTKIKLKYKLYDLVKIRYFCCYIGLPKDFKLCENVLDLNKLLIELDVPGGITYTSNDFFIEGLDPNLFWIGFDTAHPNTLNLSKKDIKLELKNMLISIVNFILKYE